MTYSLSKLKTKEVINLLDGQRLGCIDDIEFEADTGRITALTIFGRPRFFGIFGREDNIVLSVSEVELIGKDTVLVRYDPSGSAEKDSRKSFILDKIRHG